MRKTPQFNLIFAAHDDGEAMAAYAHIVWAETLAELDTFGALGRSQKSRLAAVERYCRFRTEFQFLYPHCMAEGPVKRGANGDYVNLKYSAINRLDEKMMRFDEMFARWCGGPTVAEPSTPPKKPSPADEFLYPSQPRPALKRTQNAN